MYSGRSYPNLPYRAGAKTFQSGVSTPPEWLDTNKAPPAEGKVSKPRTSGRNHRLMTGATALIKSSVNVGSHSVISVSGNSLPPSLPLRLFRCCHAPAPFGVGLEPQSPRIGGPKTLLRSPFAV